MDAKSKANFINSVPDAQGVTCPECGAKNKANSNFCLSCGKELTAASDAESKPAFAPASETTQEVKKEAKYVEPVSVFAQGLPSWDIVPPQIMVRRH